MTELKGCKAVMANPLNSLEADGAEVASDDVASKKSRWKARKKAEIRASRDVRAAAECAEGRMSVGNSVFTGTVVERFDLNGSSCGYILPSDPAKLPKIVKTGMAVMLMDAVATGAACETDEGTLFLRMCDVFMGVKIVVGTVVKFKVYVDDEWVGAYDVGLA